MSRVDLETNIARTARRRAARGAAAAAIITGLLPLASAASPSGPSITFFGPVNQQSVPLTCPGVTQDGVPICNLDAPTNFLFVIEGRPGPSAAAVASLPSWSMSSTPLEDTYNLPRPYLRGAPPA